MAYVFRSAQIGMPAITFHGTYAPGNPQKTPPWTLGDIQVAVDPTYGAGEFIFLKGAAGTAEKAWVTYSADDGSTTALLADAVGPVAVAMAATVSGEYGWYQITGKALGLCKTSFADDGRVCATSTSWTVDDASVTGDLVVNALGASTTAVSSGYAEFDIARPFVDNDSSTGA